NNRTNWPTLGGRAIRPCDTSHRSTFSRVAPRGIAPCTKSRTPFGLMASSRATLLKEERAASRATASRNKPIGSVGPTLPRGRGASTGSRHVGFPTRLRDNCTNCTSSPTTYLRGASPARAALGDFARALAPARLVMPEQLLHPPGRREPTRRVGVGEQHRDGAPELLRLLGREVRRELAQQPNELTHARRARGAVLGGEPAFQLCAGGAAGSRAVQKVAQAVRADRNGLGRAA